MSPQQIVGQRPALNTTDAPEAMLRDGKPAAAGRSYWKPADKKFKAHASRRQRQSLGEVLPRLPEDMVAEWPAVERSTMEREDAMMQQALERSTQELNAEVDLALALAESAEMERQRLEASELEPWHLLDSHVFSSLDELALSPTASVADSTASWLDLAGDDIGAVADADEVPSRWSYAALVARPAAGGSTGTVRRPAAAIPPLLQRSTRRERATGTEVEELEYDEMNGFWPRRGTKGLRRQQRG
eukprot:gnl/TRDRNA2_/TRDRNA2_84659_c0_seq1.p1 gnl/TRDRNA2_/TRDRNA2_84659_c0~~gnl/TRDRNA2_/TRDRNA2_84659_c0_seq1.p1  ORF type:complete len:266 (-),score=57.42 gnl/TRDRNA2_/TRDRNA2_84659_c0_seq1:283-1017(-)